MNHESRHPTGPTPRRLDELAALLASGAPGTRSQVERELRHMARRAEQTRDAARRARHSEARAAMRAAVGAEPLSDSVSIDTLDDDDLILLGLGLCVNPAGFEKLDDAGGRWSVHRTDDGAIVLRWDES